MRRRLTARVLLTFFTTAISGIALALIVDIVRQSLADNYAAAIPDTVNSIATVGLLLFAIIAIATWWMAGHLLEPMHQLRRDLRLAARIRAIAEPHTGELAEIRALRATIVSVLSEMDARIRFSES